MLQCPFAGFSDPDSQPALPPGPSAAGYGTPLKKCPELDLSITSTPERLVPVDSGILRKNRGVKPPSRQVRLQIYPRIVYAPKTKNMHIFNQNTQTNKVY